jgi:hypothetical protein
MTGLKQILANKPRKLTGACETERDVASIGEDELFHFDGGLLGAEVAQEDASDFISEAFDEFEGVGGAELGDALGDIVVIYGMGNVVRLCGAGEIAGHFNTNEEALGLGAFFLGYADFAKDAEVFDGDGIYFHGRA